MRNQKVLFILICFSLIFISTQFSAFATENWQKVETNNFTLIGNGSEKKITKIGIKLEQFREAIQRIDSKLTTDSHIPTTVIIFKDNESFHKFKPLNADGQITDWIAGYFQAGIDKNYIVLSFESKNADAFQTIFHEYTHNLIDTNYGRKNVPTWFGEGLAEFYDQFKVDNDQTVKFGGRNDAHIKVLRENDLIPLNKFFRTDYETLRLQNQAEANVFYAQAWAMMHYFIRSEKGRKKPQLDKFIQLLIEKKDLEKSFNESFDMTYEDLESKVENYFKIKKFYYTKKKFNQKLTQNIETNTSQMTNAQVDAYLGDLFYQRKLYTKAEKHIQKALRVSPSMSFANSTLGLIRMKQGSFANAKLYFERSVKQDTKDYLIYYRYAFFLSRDATSYSNILKTYSNERTVKMRDALSKSIKLKADFPDSYQLLGFINLVRNEKFEEGIKHLKKAISLKPKNQYYKLNLAELYLRKRDLQMAEDISSSLLQSPDNDEIKLRANDLMSIIQRINNNVYSNYSSDNVQEDKSIYSEVLSSSNMPRALTEDELERNRKQTENEAISEVLRKPKLEEKRIVGQITNVICESEKIIFEVSTDNQIKLFQSKSLINLLMKTYTAEMSGIEFSCGNQDKEVLSVLIYKPTTHKNSQIIGEVNSIEFVPKDFILVTGLD